MPKLAEPSPRACKVCFGIWEMWWMPLTEIGLRDFWTFNLGCLFSLELRNRLTRACRRYSSDLRLISIAKLCGSRVRSITFFKTVSKCSHFCYSNFLVSFIVCNWKLNIFAFKTTQDILMMPLCASANNNQCFSQFYWQINWSMNQ